MSDNSVLLAFGSRNGGEKQEDGPRTSRGGTLITNKMFSTRAEEIGLEEEEQASSLKWIVDKSFSDELPEGWEEAKDEEGNVFYYNVNTDESSWDHPLIDKYRKLYIDEKEKFALPLPPPPSSSDLISLEEQEKEVDQSNDLNDNYNYIPKENPSLETEVINLKNELLNCQVSMQKSSKYIIQHLRQRGRTVDDVDDADSPSPDKISLALWHLRRVIQQHVSADEEVAVNVSNLRKRVDEVEFELEDAEDRIAELQHKLDKSEDICDKLGVKLDRSKARERDMTDEINSLITKNEKLYTKYQKLRQEQRESSTKDDNTEYKVRVEQERVTELEANVVELKKLYSYSQEQCREAEKTAEELKLKMKTDELQNQATLKEYQNEVKGERERADSQEKVLNEMQQQVEKIQTELGDERKRYQDLETVMSLKNSNLTTLNNRLKEEIQSLKEELGKVHDRFLSLAKEESSLKAQHENKCQRLKELEVDNSELKQKIIRVEAKIQDSERVMKSSADKIMSLESELTRERDRLRDSSAKECELADDFKRLEENSTEDKKRLDAQILELREELQSCFVKTNELNKSKEHAEQEAIKAKEALQSLQECDDQLKEQLAAAQASIKDLEVGMANVRVQCENECRQHQATTAKSAEQGEELKQCRERLLQLTQSETALKTELKMIRENEKEKVSTLNETLETLRADFEEQRGAFDSLQKEKVKLEHDLDMQIKQVIEKEVKAKDLESKLASKASELELELNRNKELISGQESDSARLVEELQKAVEGKNIEIEQLHSRNEALSGDCEGLRSRACESEQNTLLKLKELEAEQRRCAELQKSLEEKSSESAAMLMRFQQELELKEAELKEAREKVLNISTAEAQLRIILQGEEESNAELKSSLKDTQQMLNNQTSKNLELIGTERELRALLATEKDHGASLLNAAQSELVDERKKFHESITDLKNQLTETEEALSNERRKCHEMEVVTAERLKESSLLCEHLKEVARTKEEELKQKHNAIGELVRKESEKVSLLNSANFEREKLEDVVSNLNKQLDTHQKDNQDMRMTISNMELSIQRDNDNHQLKIEEYVVKLDEEKRKCEEFAYRNAELSRKLDDSVNSIQDSHKELAQHRATVEELRKCSVESEEKLNASNALVEDYLEKLKNMEMKQESTERERDGLASQLAEVKCELAAERVKCEDLNMTKGSLHTKLQHLVEENKFLTQSVGNCELKIAECKEELTVIKVKLEQETASFVASTEENEKLRADLDMARQRLCEMSAKEEAQNSLVSGDLMEKLKLSECNLDAARENLSRCEARCLELEQHLKSREAELNEDLKVTKSNLARTEADLSSERLKNSEHINSMIDLERKLSVVSVNLEHKENDCAEALQKLNIMTTEHEAQRTECLEMSTTNVKLAANYEKETEKVSALNEIIDELKNRLAASESSVKVLESAKAQVEADSETKQAHSMNTIDELKTALQSERYKCDSLAKRVEELEQSVEVLSKQVESERDRCHGLENDIRECVKESNNNVERTLQDINLKDTEIAQAREKILSLTKDEAELRAQIEALDKKATAATDKNLLSIQEQLNEHLLMCSELQECQKCVSSMQDNLRAEREKLLDVTEDCAHLRTSIEVYSEKLRQTEMENSRLREHHNQEVLEYQRRCEESKEEKLSVECELKKVKSDYETAMSSIAALEAESRVLKDVITSHENKASRLEGDIEKIRKENDVNSQTLTSEIAVLKEERHAAAELKAQLTRATAELEEKKVELNDSLIAQRETLVDLNDKNAKISELELEISHLTKKEEETQSIQDILQYNFAVLSSSIGSMQESHVQAKESEGVSKLHGDIRVLEVKVSTLNEKVSDEKQRAKEAEKALASTTSELSSCNSTIARLEMELKNKSESKRATVKEMNEKVIMLEKQAQEANSQLQLTLLENKQLSENIKNSSASDKKQIEALENKVSEYKRAKSKLAIDLEREKDTSARLKSDLDEVRGSAESVQSINENLTTMVKALTARIKKLNEIIVELKGSIRVFCRVRPVEFTEDCVESEIDELVQYPDYNLIDFKKSSFEFDQVFAPSSSQETIYEEVEPFVRSAMGGLRVCIFAYGQTSSGKTYTMEGPVNDRGVNLRALETVIEMSASTMEEYTSVVKISILEVYNEKIKDLLDLSGEDLEVRLGKQGTYVHNLSEWPVKTVDDALELFARGQSNRQVASNNVNEHSSRSHLVILVKITRTSMKRRGEGLEGYLYLVDLAGSERIKQTAATGQRLKEAQNINKSLSSLGDVISALATSQKHVPYRNSKLTYLLQDALRDNSKVLMFVNINPTPAYSSESVCSLNFASRCRSVSLGQATKKVIQQDQKSSSSSSSGISQR